MLNNKNNKLLFYILLLGQLISKFILSNNWKDIESNTQDSVVQVLSQIAKFNWTEPYKSPEQMQATGTAFFISEEGYLLTNFHVIDQAKSIYINVPSCGRKLLEVEVKGVYPERDIALMKVKKESYEEIIKTLGYIPYLPLGNSDATYRTEPVLALGYPLGQRYLKSTVGVVAGRDFISGFSYIHITAPINPGNSGGPLLNLSGEVIGINTAYIKGSQNICFIVPINEVKSILEDLYKVKLYRKPQIGISCNHATEEHVQLLNNPVPGGLYVNYVLTDSLAYKAGIKKGDMLYELIWQGTSYQVDEYGDVKVDWRGCDKVSIGELINRFQLNDKVTAVVYRNGKKLELDFSFESDVKHPIRYIYPDYEKEEIDYEVFGGAVFMQLRENHFGLLPESYAIKKYHHPEAQAKQAILITNIFPGSIMHKVQCFYPGAILDSINNQKIRTLEDLRSTLIDSINNSTLSIKTKDGFATVLSLDKILEEEPRLSNNFVYPMSKTIKQLIKIKSSTLNSKL